MRERLDDAVGVERDDGVVAVVRPVGRVAHEEAVGERALLHVDPEEPPDRAARAVRADDERRGLLDHGAVGSAARRAHDAAGHVDRVRVQPGERHAAPERVGGERLEAAGEDRLGAPLREHGDVRVGRGDAVEGHAAERPPVAHGHRPTHEHGLGDDRVGHPHPLEGVERGRVDPDRPGEPRRLRSCLPHAHVEPRLREERREVDPHGSPADDERVPAAHRVAPGAPVAAGSRTTSRRDVGAPSTRHPAGSRSASSIGVQLRRMERSPSTCTNEPRASAFDRGQ
jgi:hypothetical protein